MPNSKHIDFVNKYCNKCLKTLNCSDIDVELCLLVQKNNLAIFLSRIVARAMDPYCYYVCQNSSVKSICNSSEVARCFIQTSDGDLLNAIAVEESELKEAIEVYTNAREVFKDLSVAQLTQNNVVFKEEDFVADSLFRRECYKPKPSKFKNQWTNGSNYKCKNIILKKSFMYESGRTL